MEMYTNNKSVNRNKLKSTIMNKLFNVKIKCGRPDGRSKSPKSMKMNLMKFTITKLVLLLCTSLLTQSIIPDGWKVSDAYKNKKSQTNYKNEKEQQNYKMEDKTFTKLYRDGITMETYPGTGSRENWVNVRIWKDLNNWGIAPKVRNSLIKAKNGNISKNMSLLHWNLGNRKWENKVEDVQALVDDFNPDICFISEVNLFNEKPDYMCSIEGYKLTKAKTTVGLGYSRIVMLMKNGLHYTLEEARMEEEISTIWIRVGEGAGRVY